MVEPIFGILGAVTVTIAQPMLPYALSFAAGAMIYVVVDDIIPEANTKWVYFRRNSNIWFLSEFDYFTTMKYGTPIK